MSKNYPHMGESNVRALIDQINGWSLPLDENESIEYRAGVIRGKTMAVETIKRMWLAVETISAHTPEVKESHISADELTEVAYTLRMLASTVEGR